MAVLFYLHECRAVVFTVILSASYLMHVLYCHLELHWPPRLCLHNLLRISDDLHAIVVI